MSSKIDTSSYLIDGSHSVDLSELPNKIPDLYQDKKDYRKLLEDCREEINELQRMMYAHDRHSVLLIFQAMDAAGKDGTIRNILSGVNVHGVTVHSFKKPSDEELDHDFLWRTSKQLPQRGRIGVFNRSYYEEVLIVKVHPEILTKYQRIPRALTSSPDLVWEERYRSIRDLEAHLARNGTLVLKFFLHLSKREQRDRFIARIDEAEKNWKFSEGDVKERQFWDQYQQAYQDAINATATPHAPWFVIPADDKKNMRLIAAQIVREQLRGLDMHYPKVDEARRKELQVCREGLLQEDPPESA